MPSSQQLQCKHSALPGCLLSRLRPASTSLCTFHKQPLGQHCRGVGCDTCHLICHGLKSQRVLKNLTGLPQDAAVTPQTLPQPDGLVSNRDSPIAFALFWQSFEGTNEQVTHRHSRSIHYDPATELRRTEDVGWTEGCCDWLRERGVSSLEDDDMEELLEVFIGCFDLAALLNAKVYILAVVHVTSLG